MSKFILVLAVVGAFALAGCASSNNSTTTTPTTSTSPTGTTNGGVPELDYVATQSGPPSNDTTYMYAGPDHTTAGWNLIKITNQALEPHQVVFMKLKDGETLDQHMQAMMAMSSGNMSMDSTPDMYAGGVAASSPAGPPGAPTYPTSSETYVWLDPGSYVIECEIPGAAGPHMFHGMMKQVNVTGTAPAMTTNEPKADFTVTEKDFNFTWDATPTAGHHIIKVVNDGSMPHEWAVFHLAGPNATIDSTLAWLQVPNGAPPFADTFGGGAMEKSQTEYVVVDLVSGKYGEACFMPAPDGRPHFLLGMKGEFTVA